MNGLHWSVNGARPEQPDYEIKLQSCLRQAYGGSEKLQKPDPAVTTHSYSILPRYWRGYIIDSKELQTGYFRLSRKKVAGKWEYRAQVDDTTTGESSRSRFLVNDDKLRTLTGTWNIEARNHSGDIYTRYEAVGSFADTDGRRELRLRLNGYSVPIHSLADAEPMVTREVLFDLIPTLQRSKKRQLGCFAMLEDFQRVSTDCSITKIGGMEIDPIGALEGFCVTGRGHEPSYWWVDANGLVAIVAFTFRAFVLTDIDPQGNPA